MGEVGSGNLSHSIVNIDRILTKRYHQLKSTAEKLISQSGFATSCRANSFKNTVALEF